MRSEFHNGYAWFAALDRQTQGDIGDEAVLGGGVPWRDLFEGEMPPAAFRRGVLAALREIEGVS